jgi:hypothetical protein
VWSVSHNGAQIETYKRLDPLAGGIPVPSGTIDLQTIWSSVPVSALALSLTNGSPACPAGFAADHTDLNFGAGGAYAYVCVARATRAAAGRFVTAVTAVVGAAPLACPPGMAAAGGDAKAGTAAAAAALICFATSDDARAAPRVATHVGVAQGRRGGEATCPPGQEAAGADLSAGVGERTVLCVRWEPRTPEVEARADFDGATRTAAGAVFSTVLAADKGAGGAKVAVKGADVKAAHH